MNAPDVVTVLRALVALGVVLALVVIVARKDQAGKLRLPGLVRPTNPQALRVVARQGLGGRAQVALVEVEGRHIVVGVTDTQVTMLTEVEPFELAQPTSVEDPALGEESHENTTTDPAARKPQATSPGSPIEGSVLAPDTWRQTWDAVRGRTKTS